MSQRTAAEILAELTTYREARSSLVSGERVEDVTKDGRRMKFSAMSLKDINAAISSLEREYESALSGESGRPRRRPMNLAYRN